jgi:NAD(P)H-dependent FMN reductase
MTPSVQPLRVFVLGASLRTGSYNVALARLAARAVKAAGAKVDHAEFAEFRVPGYDADEEQSRGVPEGARLFGERLGAADAFVVASPEYNASLPGTVKNLIDWTSRLRPQPLWGTHGLVMSASPRLSGGSKGLWALRVPLEHLGVRVYPEMFSLPQADQALTPDGEIADEKLAKRLERTIAGFLELVEASVRYPALRQQWIDSHRPDPGTRLA